MPIGGLSLEKNWMEATQRRPDIKNVFIPYDNQRRSGGCGRRSKAELHIIPVKRVEEVLKHTGLISEDK